MIWWWQSGTPEGTIHKVEPTLGVVLMAGTDLGFDHNRRKILSALKTSFCLALIIYKITMPVLSFLNLAEQMLIERKNIHSVITQLESEKR